NKPVLRSFRLAGWLNIVSSPGLVNTSPILCISPGLRAYSPLLKSAVDSVLIKVLKPSSIQPYRRSFDPTIIGNQVWPNSWSFTPHKLPFLALYPQKTIPGYSIPPTIPATAVAAGYGNSYHCFELYSIDFFTYSVERPQASTPSLSTG